MKRPTGLSLLTGLALVTIPLAAYAAAEPAPKSGDYYTKKVCRTVTPTGSRLNGTRVCRTQAELDAVQKDARRTVERVQAYKPVICAPPNPC